MPDQDSLPMADPSYEKFAEETFPYREMSSKEYAARHGYGWVCFSFGNYRYHNVTLNQWIKELDLLLFTPGALQQAQEEILTPEELSWVRSRMEEDI